MLLVHRLRMIGVNIATHVVGANDIDVAHRFDRLDGGRRCGLDADLRLRTRGTGSKEHERNEREVFHGWSKGCAADGTVGGTAVNAGYPWMAAELVLSSSAKAVEAPMTASARSTVWSTYR